MDVQKQKLKIIRMMIALIRLEKIESWIFLEFLYQTFPIRVRVTHDE